MTSRRKLEEEIARTKDPIVRKQLQELVEKREERWDKKINNAKETGSSLLNEIEKVEPIKRVSEFFWVMVIGYIIIILIVLFIG